MNRVGFPGDYGMHLSRHDSITWSTPGLIRTSVVLTSGHMCFVFPPAAPISRIAFGLGMVIAPRTKANSSVYKVERNLSSMILFIAFAGSDKVLRSKIPSSLSDIYNQSLL